MSRILMCLCVAAALLSPPLSNTAYSGPGRGGNVRAEVRIEGKIVAVDLTKAQVTIMRSNGERVTVQVVAGTKIERNDRHVTLVAFKVGDRGQARLVANVLVKIEAKGP